MHCGLGDVGWIVVVTSLIENSYNVDFYWVFVMGLLVGGVMMLVMVVIYLDYFVVIGIGLGCEYVVMVVCVGYKSVDFIGVG